MKKILSISLIVASLAAGARAEMYITPRIGLSLGDVKGSNQFTGNSLYFGGSAGSWLTDSFAVEVEGYYINDFSDIDERVSNGRVNLGLQGSLMVNGLYRFPEYNEIIPYLLAGMGAQSATIYRAPYPLYDEEGNPDGYEPKREESELVAAGQIGAGAFLNLTDVFDNFYLDVSIRVTRSTSFNFEGDRYSVSSVVAAVGIPF